MQIKAFSAVIFTCCTTTFLNPEINVQLFLSLVIALASAAPTPSVTGVEDAALVCLSLPVCDVILTSAHLRTLAKPRPILAADGAATDSTPAFLIVPTMFIRY